MAAAWVVLPACSQTSTVDLAARFRDVHRLLAASRVGNSLIGRGIEWTRVITWPSRLRRTDGRGTLRAGTACCRCLGDRLGPWPSPSSARRRRAAPAPDRAAQLCFSRPSARSPAASVPSAGRPRRTPTEALVARSTSTPPRPRDRSSPRTSEAHLGRGQPLAGSGDRPGVHTAGLMAETRRQHGQGEELRLVA